MTFLFIKQCSEHFCLADGDTVILYNRMNVIFIALEELHLRGPKPRKENTLSPMTKISEHVRHVLFFLLVKG